MPLRWLAPLLTVLALLVQPLAAFASAGAKADIKCCCPDPKICKCHDHDGHDTGTTMKRCSGAEHQVVPQLAETTLPEPLLAIEIVASAREIEHVVLALDDIPGPAPEKPPF